MDNILNTITAYREERKWSLYDLAVHHSLGQNNETSVTRGPVITKTGWLKKPMWSVGASPHLPRCIPNPTGVEDK